MCSKQGLVLLSKSELENMKKDLSSFKSASNSTNKSRYSNDNSSNNNKSRYGSERRSTVQGCKNFQNRQKNKEMTTNAYFSKFQNMIIHISNELFWHFQSNTKKKQVKLVKINNFVVKI